MWSVPISYNYFISYLIQGDFKLYFLLVEWVSLTRLLSSWSLWLKVSEIFGILEGIPSIVNSGSTTKFEWFWVNFFKRGLICTEELKPEINLYVLLLQSDAYNYKCEAIQFWRNLCFEFFCYVHIFLCSYTLSLKIFLSIEIVINYFPSSGQPRNVIKFPLLPNELNICQKFEMAVDFWRVWE